MSENPKLLVDTDGAPLDRIVGFETEYGFDIQKPNDNSPYGRTTAISALSGNTFLTSEQFQEDGDRAYVDTGNHPEVSTAEETSFIGAAHRLLRGHVKEAELYAERYANLFKKATLLPNDLEEVIGAFRNGDVYLVANTIDRYNNSWGSHENTLTRRELEPSDYTIPLAIHHLSRIVWSGAGHVLGTKEGPAFCLSEKAEHIWEVEGSGTTRSRPLVNTRDEPLADPKRFRRIHNVAGESVFSPFVNALRLASGSIILRACEYGVSFDDLLPQSPIEAVREISYDPTLRTKVQLEDMRFFSGVDLQKALAERAIQAAADQDYLTSQERYWAEEWIQLLDDLTVDPSGLDTKLDWVVKQRLVERALAKRDPGSDPFEAMQAASFRYHWLLPQEGVGMKLVRKGHFEGSPSAETLENDMPLPQTRALLRAKAIAVFRRANRTFTADWMHLNLTDAINGALILKDPYIIEDERVDKVLERISKPLR